MPPTKYKLFSKIFEIYAANHNSKTLMGLKSVAEDGLLSSLHEVIRLSGYKVIRL